MTAKVMIFLIAALMVIGYVACESPLKKKLVEKIPEKPVEHTKEARKEGRMENLEHEEVDVVDVDETAASHQAEDAHSKVEAQGEGTLNRHKRGGYGGQGYGHNVQDHKRHEKVVVVVGEGHQGHGGFNGHEGYNHGGFGDHGGHGGHGGYGEHGGHGGGGGYGGGHGYGRRR